MSDYNHQDIANALYTLKSQGLSNQEIITEAKQIFDLSQQQCVVDILQESEFSSKIIRPTKNYNHNYLFELIYQAVVSGTPTEQIIAICTEELNLEDLAFSKLALEYILINRHISQYERDAFIIDLYHQYQESKSYQGLIKIAESTKNIYLKQLVYKTAELVAKKTGEVPSLSITKNVINSNNPNSDTTRHLRKQAKPVFKQL